MWILFSPDISISGLYAEIYSAFFSTITLGEPTAYSSVIQHCNRTPVLGIYAVKMRMPVSARPSCSNLISLLMMADIYGSLFPKNTSHEGYLNLEI
jgi:hypothetical protein